MNLCDRVTQPPRDNFIDCLYGKGTVIVMLGLTLKCKDGESHTQIHDNVIYYLNYYGPYFDNN